MATDTENLLTRVRFPGTLEMTGFQGRPKATQYRRRYLVFNPAVAGVNSHPPLAGGGTGVAKRPQLITPEPTATG